MSFERGVVIFLGLFVGAAGIASIVAPASVAQQAGWSAERAGLTEIRAFYGGVQIGLGVFLLWCSRRRERLLAGLLASGLAVGAIGAGRAIGLIVDRALTPYHLLNLGIEIATVVLVSVAVSKHRGRDRRRREAGAIPPG